jgi:hypothetical protein
MCGESDPDQRVATLCSHTVHSDSVWTRGAATGTSIAKKTKAKAHEQKGKQQFTVY